MPQMFTGDMLLPMFEAVTMKSQQLEQAIRSGNDELVRLIDREIDPLISAVVEYRARNPSEIQQQLRFVSSLIREYADDRACVVRTSAILNVLIERYFGGEQSASLEGIACGLPMTRQAGDDSLLNESILDNIPVRVAVITRDYRFLLGNAAEAEFYGIRGFELIGRHVAEFIGHDVFENKARLLLDRCFDGDVFDFHYQCDRSKGNKRIYCRMKPLRGQRGNIVGAVVVNEDVVGSLSETLVTI